MRSTQTRRSSTPSSIELLVFTTGLLIDTLSIRKKIPSPSLNDAEPARLAPHADRAATRAYSLRRARDRSAATALRRSAAATLDGVDPPTRPSPFPPRSCAR